MVFQSGYSAGRSRLESRSNWYYVFAFEEGATGDEVVDESTWTSDDMGRSFSASIHISKNEWLRF